MNKIIFLLVACVATQCFADEIQLGVISNRNCSRLSYDKAQNQNNIKDQQQDLLPSRINENATVALTAQYESTPLDQHGLDIVRSCALHVRDKMNLREIDFDPIEASPVFQQILQDCVGASDPTIKIFSVILRSKGPCAR